MTNRLTIALAAVGVATAGLSVAPASAQDYYGRDGHNQRYQNGGDGYDQGNDDQDARYQNYRQQRAYQRHHRQTEYARRAENSRYNQRGGYQGYDRGQGYAARGNYPQAQTYYQGSRCKSGTTGAILGAVVGGLLGREVGRGGYYNEPSTTGLIVGAGGGALAGRAIERSGNNCR